MLGRAGAGFTLAVHNSEVMVLHILRNTAIDIKEKKMGLNGEQGQL